MMESQHQIKLAPNGNGALFDSLRSNPEVRSRIASLEYVQIIGVDNPLNKVLDPIQIGFTHNDRLDTSLKSVPKRDAEEKVGVIGKKNGKYNIVEYSEFPPWMASEYLADGTLKYNHGHILMFVVRSDFLLELAIGSAAQSNQLYHKAFKKITYCNPETWEQIFPTKENGWKFELFIHGFVPMVEQGKLGVLEVSRDTEFAPVKNADGPKTTKDGEPAEPLPDTPSYARKMILAEASQWLEAEGLEIDSDAKGNIEVSFLLTYAGENLSWLKTKQTSQSREHGTRGYLDHEGNYTRK